MPTNCYECNAPLSGTQCKMCNPVNLEPAAWWAMFIEHWAAQGVDRRELNAAVVKFRAAQSGLSDALNSART